jgi:hypothetical protein
LRNFRQSGLHSVLVVGDIGEFEARAQIGKGTGKVDKIVTGDGTHSATQRVQAVIPDSQRPTHNE